MDNIFGISQNGILDLKLKKKKKKKKTKKKKEDWRELQILNDIKSSKFVRKQLVRTSFGLDPKQDWVLTQQAQTINL